MTMSGRGDRRRALGIRIRTVRTAVGQSQQGLSERTGIHRVGISDIERGVRGLDALELIDIAAALGVPVRVLLEAPVDETDLIQRLISPLCKTDQQKVVEYAALLALVRPTERPNRYMITL